MLSTSGRTAYLYQSSTFVQSQIPVAESASECFIFALWHEYFNDFSTMSTRLLLVSTRYHHFKLSKRPRGTKLFGTKRQFIGTSGYVLWVFLSDCDASP